MQFVFCKEISTINCVCIIIHVTLLCIVIIIQCILMLTVLKVTV